MTGWAQRRDPHTIVFHYFDNGVSVCAMRWTDPQVPFRTTVLDGKICPRCAVLRPEHL